MKSNYARSIIIFITVMVSALSLKAYSAPAPNEAQRQIELYRTISSVTASVRKTTEAADSTVRMLSRVHYKKGGFIHVENIAPAKRRIIADGKNLYYYDENVARGFSRPISELDEEWTSSLNTVPGSPMEHLLKMQKLEQSPATAPEPDQTAFAYHDAKNHVVMTLDAEKRIVKIEFFEDQKLTRSFAIFKYSHFIKAGDVWLSSTHTASSRLPDGSELSEVRQFDNVSVNKDIPDKLFDHKLFMDEVEFVSEFEKTWE